MPEICFTNSNCSISDLIGHDPADLSAFRNCNALPGNSWLGPWSAYTLDVNDPLARSVVHRVNARPDPRLFIANTAQAGRMATMIRFLGHAGNAAILLDGYLRVGAIRTAHQDGKDWVKESVVQVTGFGFAGAIGGAVGNAAVKTGSRIGGQIMLRASMSAVPALLSAGPLGWLILGVVVGVGVGVGVGVYAGYEAGKWGDSKGKSIASDLWGWSKS